MSEALTWSGLDLQWAYSDVLNRISRHTFCKHKAFDILQDAIVYFAVSRSPYRDTEPQAYLNGIVNNLLVNQYRQEVKFVPYDEVALEESTTDYSPEQLYETKQKLFYLQRIVDLLPEKCRQVFWLFHVDGLKQKEIADKLGISLNMVEKHMIRAMLDLRAAKQKLL
ncbi:RNA polymerase sigma factor, sigma-70 family [Methylophilaceae bacterium 11]|jgi:RNA polymerase sigma-70 factor (ECF subfamily)|uniref:RNA polymerase sigma factor n=1 Tax=unclassified Methylotenera TaxID=2643294 RepID=UPI00036414A6|nr:MULTISPECIES: sigma-70 family RNA polymerase sigma factor [unclassified Methylotenera]EUJ10979.1 RNA polymerase sigma factor, sigma-70 family [Methylophilaceae bacterium 11]